MLWETEARSLPAASRDFSSTIRSHELAAHGLSGAVDALEGGLALAFAFLHPDDGGVIGAEQDRELARGDTKGFANGPEPSGARGGNATRGAPRLESLVEPAALLVEGVPVERLKGGWGKRRRSPSSRRTGSS